MDLSEVMVLLDRPLILTVSGILSVRDKTIQQMKFLFEMTEKLTCSAFPTASETEVGDVGGQSHNFILSNI